MCATSVASAHNEIELAHTHSMEIIIRHDKIVAMAKIYHHNPQKNINIHMQKYYHPRPYVFTLQLFAMRDDSVQFLRTHFVSCGSTPAALSSTMHNVCANVQRTEQVGGWSAAGIHLNTCISDWTSW